MMRHRMMLTWHTDMGKRPRAELARENHREHACDVGLVREHHKIQHHLCIVVEGFRHVDGPVDQLNVVRALRFSVLDALLYLADGVGVFVEFGAIATPERLSERVHFVENRVKNAPRTLYARHPLRRASAVSKQTLEYNSRMRFCGVWRRFITPRDGIDVETVTGIAGSLSWEIHREFDRRQLSRFTDNPGRILVGCRCKPHFDTRLRPIVRVDSRQPCG